MHIPHIRASGAFQQSHIHSDLTQLLLALETSKTPRRDLLGRTFGSHFAFNSSSSFHHRWPKIFFILGYARLLSLHHRDIPKEGGQLSCSFIFWVCGYWYQERGEENDAVHSTPFSVRGPAGTLRPCECPKETGRSGSSSLGCLEGAHSAS